MSIRVLRVLLVDEKSFDYPLDHFNPSYGQHGNILKIETTDGKTIFIPHCSIIEFQETDKEVSK